MGSGSDSWTAQRVEESGGDRRAGGDAGDARRHFPRGATWGPDDTIIVATANLATGLQRVGAAGGPTTVLTRPDRAQGEPIISGRSCCRAAGPCCSRSRRSRVASMPHKWRSWTCRPGRARSSCAAAVTPTTCRAAISSTRRPAPCGRCRSTWPVWRRAARPCRSSLTS